MTDDADTVVETSRRRRPDVPPTVTSSTTISSPLQALEHDELNRTRRFCLIGGLICIAGGISVALLPGDPTASALLLSSVGCALMSIVFLYVRTGDPDEFRKPSTMLGWFLPAVCATCVIPFFGVFSPSPIVMVLGIYFTGLGRSGKLATAVYVVCAGTQGGMATLVIADVIRDPGIVQIMPLGTAEQVVVQLLVQIVLLSTFVTARVSRSTTLAAVGELEKAVRLAAHREALLLEAREELERARQSGRGRFSEQTIGGYALGDILGRGAMGEVYAGRSPSGQQVAIKLLSHASLGNLQHVLRFLRELETAAALQSDNIVRVIAVGESPVPYLVMERLEGHTLSELLKMRAALSGPEVIDMVRQVGAGIAAAAAAGIIHRDLKPANVFLHGATWKVLDFGVARAIDASDTLTAGRVVGTPSYMAPEQAGGHAVDFATDLYALAATAYRALTGHPPYAAGELAETLYRVIHTSPRRPSDLIAVPPAVDLVLAIGLAKRPADRFASAHELADALAAAYTDTLPPALRDRGGLLVRVGAWAGPKHRHSTSRLR